MGHSQICGLGAPALHSALSGRRGLLDRAAHSHLLLGPGVAFLWPFLSLSMPCAAWISLARVLSQEPILIISVSLLKNRIAFLRFRTHCIRCHRGPWRPPGVIGCLHRLKNNDMQGPEKRAEYGIKDNLIRYSCGLEGVEDLWRDLVQALEAVG